MGNCIDFILGSKKEPDVEPSKPTIVRPENPHKVPNIVDGNVILIAVHSFDSRADGDLSFKKGDLLYLLDRGNYDWWFVRHLKTNETGYVPRNFVAKQHTIESEEWYVGKMTRFRAERLILANNLPKGTFLVRQREADLKEYALSIKDSDINEERVKHYKIKRLDNDMSFYITPKKTFNSLQELVAHYKEQPNGLCSRLTLPAPRIEPIIDLDHDTQSNFEIPRHQIKLIKKLASGNFGEVWYGKWRGMVEVAVKTMISSRMSIEAFLQEGQIMKQCDHANLVKLYAVCTKEEPFFIITEYMCNGSLLQYLRNRGDALDLQILVDMAAQIASGMMYLEERKLVHRDLAARNVLVGDDTNGAPLVKVGDFGLARKLMEEDVFEARTGTKFPLKWTAPEAANNGIFTVKSDVWSYGILIFEIMTRGQDPYQGIARTEVLQYISNGYRMPCPKDCPDVIYYNIMLKCWDKIPEKRPTFETLYHYFEDFFVAAQPNYM